MADTGYNFEDTWTTLQSAVVLTQGGTVENISATPIAMDGKAGVEITVKAVYSNHAKATAGLKVYIERDANDAYEDNADEPYGWEMPFTQNGTNRNTIFFGPASNLKVHLVWDNTTANSVVTVTTSYKRATIPVAS